MSDIESEIREALEVLNLPPLVSLNEIKSRYRVLSKKYHPDINKDPAAEDKFKKINEAYTILTDESAKAKYMSEVGGARGRGFGGMNFEDIFRHFGGMGFGGMRGSRMYADSGPQKATLEIPLDIMISGSDITINVNGHNVEVTIPKDCINGHEIHFSDNGMDIIFNVVASRNYDSSTIIINNDIMKVVNISIIDLIFGTTISVKTPLTETDVIIPENTKQTDKIVVKGLGLKYSRGIGDLIIQLNVTIPSKDKFIEGVLSNPEFKSRMNVDSLG